MSTQKNNRRNLFRKFISVSLVLALALIIATFISKIDFSNNEDSQTTPPVKLTTEQQESYESKLQQNNQKLKDVIEKWVQDHSGYEWSIVVRGLDSDQRSASIEPNKSFRAASLYKLYLLLPLFEDYSVEELKNTFVSGANLDACTDLMLRISDNPCGESIGRFVGWYNADRIASRAGFSNTELNVAEPLTTAGEASKLMAIIYNGQVGGLEGKKYILEKLSRQSWDDGIPAGCPKCNTFNKTGDLGYVRHDVAIISGSGGSYSLAIFSNGAPYSQIAQLTKKINEVMNEPS